MCYDSELGPYVESELPLPIINHPPHWGAYREAKARWLANFAHAKKVSRVRVMIPADADHMSEVVHLDDMD